MYADLKARLDALAEQDDDRATHGEKPQRLELHLASGQTLSDVCLIDGSNSVDDETIDLKPHGAAASNCPYCIVRISAITIIGVSYPEASDA